MSIPPETRKARIERITLPISGLSCRDDSVLIVKCTLMSIQGVRYAYVNSATEMAYVEYDPSLCRPDLLREAVEQSGFHAGTPVLR